MAISLAEDKAEDQQATVHDQDHAGHVAEILKALAHPLRIQIVALLCEGPKHVSAIAQKLDAKQAIVSQQLRILRMRRLVAVKRSNGFAHYHLAEPRLKELVRCLNGCST